MGYLILSVLLQEIWSSDILCWLNNSHWQLKRWMTNMHLLEWKQQHFESSSRNVNALCLLTACISCWSKSVITYLAGLYQNDKLAKIGADWILIVILKSYAEHTIWACQICLVHSPSSRFCCPHIRQGLPINKCNLELYHAMHNVTLSRQNSILRFPTCCGRVLQWMGVGGGAMTCNNWQIHCKKHLLHDGARHLHNGAATCHNWWTNV